MSSPVLISACLVGIPCRYDGRAVDRPALLSALASRELIPVCPEVAGGLPTPRAPASLVGGDGRAVLMGAADVVDRDGRVLSEQFLAGARVSLESANRFGCKEAVLKSCSPSCGKGIVNIDGEWREGVGVTTALIESQGIRVVNDEGLLLDPMGKSSRSDP